VSEFLLLGTRRPALGELSPAGAARDLAALAAWHRCLRRWGLLRAFGVGRGCPATPGACLVVRVSGLAAAQRLAAGWGRLAGYDVTVVPLVNAADGRGMIDEPGR
jgi:hypothetical protein